jgi:hypothetical protein
VNSCAKILGLLPCFIGDDLDLEAAANVRLHLRDCVACRREAGALQQSTKALRALQDAGAEGVDEAAFAAMHESILLAVDRDAAAPVGGMSQRLVAWQFSRGQSVRRMAQRWLLSAAAAVGLFAIGWQLVRGGEDSSLLERPGLAVSFDHGGPAKAVPWSGGGHVQLRQLGDESGVHPADGDSAGGAFGAGMMGRWRLRTLEDEEFLGGDLPSPVPASADRPAGTGHPAEAGRPVKAGGR